MFALCDLSRLALDQLLDEEVHVALLRDVMQRADVRMREFETALTSRSNRCGKDRSQDWQDLDGNILLQPSVVSTIHLSHPTRAEWGLDFEGASFVPEGSAIRAPL